MKIRGLCNSNYCKILIILFVCLFVEVFICNANAFRIKNTQEYEQKTYKMDDLQFTNVDVNLEDSSITYRKEHGSFIFIEMTGINTKVGTVYLDIDIPTPYLEYKVCYTDETNSEYYRGFQREYVQGVNKSKWFTCHFNGVSEKMILRVDDLDDGYTIKINEIQINKKVPFDFSYSRFALFFIIAVLFYGIRNISLFSDTNRNWVHNTIISLVPVAFIGLSIVLYLNSFHGININTMYNTSFVDSLINRQLFLDIEVSDELMAMSNPYDTSARVGNGIQASWDTVFYNGKYYCYFGIVPALLFFVPYKLLTGVYLQCNIVVIISYSIYLLFLDLLVINLIRKCITKLSFRMEIIGILTVNAATNIFYFSTEPSFYMVLYSTGLMFVAIGFCAFFYWYSGNRKNKFLLFLGALCLSLAVGCRPPLLLYTLIIIPFGIKVIKEKKYNSISDMIVLLIPYIIIGSALATYNYLRFGSILEFGTTYQLTAQDQLHITYNIFEIPYLLWLGFFQPLNFSATFPFVFSGNSSNNYAGHFFTGSTLIPLLSQIPVIFVIFMPSVWKKWKATVDKFSFYMLGYFSTLGIVMMVIIYLNSGVEWRYTSEFAPILCISAILLIANVTKEMNEEGTKVIYSCLYGLAIYSCFVAFFASISGLFGYMLRFHPEFYYSIERMFCFWK